MRDYANGGQEVSQVDFFQVMEFVVAEDEPEKKMEKEKEILYVKYVDKRVQFFLNPDDVIPWLEGDWTPTMDRAIKHTRPFSIIDEYDMYLFDDVRIIT